mgnify:CR=1 FL=1
MAISRFPSLPENAPVKLTQLGTIAFTPGATVSGVGSPLSRPDFNAVWSFATRDGSREGSVYGGEGLVWTHVYGQPCAPAGLGEAHVLHDKQQEAPERDGHEL